MPFTISGAKASYRLRRDLGQGGMGRVYLASETVSGTHTAIKVLLKKDGSTGSDSEGEPLAEMMLRREGKLAAIINHPNVCRVYEFHQGAQPHIAMEYISGQTLKACLPSLDPVRRYDIAVMMVLGLDAIHTAKVLHRDLKPENIMISAEGVAKIMDFGLAKDSDANWSLLGSGSIVGTPKYMSPEQIDGEPLKGESDIYSLSIVIFELFAGLPPFSGSIQQLAAQHHTVDALRTKAAKSLPTDLVPILARGLEKRPDDRYHTANAMLHDLLPVARVAWRNELERLQAIEGKAAAAEEQAARTRALATSALSDAKEEYRALRREHRTLEQWAAAEWVRWRLEARALTAFQEKEKDLRAKLGRALGALDSSKREAQAALTALGDEKQAHARAEAARQALEGASIVTTRAELERVRELTLAVSQSVDQVLAKASAALTTGTREVTPHVRANQGLPWRKPLPWARQDIGTVARVALLRFSRRVLVTSGSLAFLAALTVKLSEAAGQTLASPFSAASLGAVIGALLAVRTTLRDDRIWNPEDLRSFGLPILGKIPYVEATALDLFGTNRNSGTLFNAYRALRTNLTAGQESTDGRRVILVTSPRWAEGKTTTCCGLGVVLALGGQRVLLADWDLRRASLSRLLGAGDRAGLVDLLAGVTMAKCVLRTPVKGLDLLPAGTPRSDALDTPDLTIANVVDGMRKEYDWVILDTAGALGAPEALRLSRLADSVVVVIGAGRTPAGSLRNALDDLASVSNGALGLVLNNDTSSLD